MVWAVYDTSNFPNVKVKMNSSIENNEDFNQFLEDWLSLYDYKQDFYLTFDVGEVGFVNPKYAFKMASFVKDLKKRNQDHEYLQKSYIMYKSFYVKMLLKLIFAIQSPVAPVELVDGRNLSKENERILKKSAE